MMSACGCVWLRVAACAHVWLWGLCAYLGLNVWWQRTEELDEATLDDSGPGGCPKLAEQIVLSSCDFTEQDTDDVELPTRCKPCYAAPTATSTDSGVGDATASTLKNEL